jgi:hypothetical protein
MAALSVEELYERYVKPRPTADRLRLLELTPHDLAQDEATSGDRGGLTRFIGAAKGSFATPAEADAFIRQERDAWDS